MTTPVVMWVVLIDAMHADNHLIGKGLQTDKHLFGPSP
jgi:hypothetical protein